MPTVPWFPADTSPSETITQTYAYGAANKRRQAASPTPSPLNSLNLQPAALSKACSCYVPRPSTTVTETVTQTVTRSLTATAVVVRVFVPPIQRLDTLLTCEIDHEKSLGCGGDLYIYRFGRTGRVYIW